MNLSKTYIIRPPIGGLVIAKNPERQQLSQRDTNARHIKRNPHIYTDSTRICQHIFVIS